jgi:hypothetical protein
MNGQFAMRETVIIEIRRQCDALGLPSVGPERLIGCSFTTPSIPHLVGKLIVAYCDGGLSGMKSHQKRKKY